jgi:peptide deformylase
MYAVGGVGLSATQVGIPLRVFVLDLLANETVNDHVSNLGSTLLIAINPVVEVVDPRPVIDQEGCLSFPGVSVPVRRHNRVRLKAQDRWGDRWALEVGGMFGRAIQHECDHLDGQLMLDRLSPRDKRLAVKRLRRARR